MNCLFKKPNLPFSLDLQLTDSIRACVQILLKWWTGPLRNYIYTVSNVLIGSVCRFFLVLKLIDSIRACVQIRLKWCTVPLRNYIYTVSTVIIGSVCPFLLFSSWLIVFTGSGATQKLLFIIFYYVFLGEGGEIKNIIDLFPQLLGNNTVIKIWKHLHVSVILNERKFFLYW